MKGIESNIITFSEEKSYLVNFIKTVQSNKSDYNDMLSSFIDEFVKINVRKAPFNFKIENRKLLPTEIKLIVPDFWDKENTIHYYLSKDRIKKFKDTIYKNFYYCYWNFMLQYCWIGIDIAIYKFIEIYNLPEIKFDMLKKDFGRKRKKSFKIKQ